MKDLNYYKKNAEEDYNTTPISVLRYITELEEKAKSKHTLTFSEYDVQCRFECTDEQAYEALTNVTKNEWLMGEIGQVISEVGHIMGLTPKEEE